MYLFLYISAHHDEPGQRQKLALLTIHERVRRSLNLTLFPFFSAHGDTFNVEFPVIPFRFWVLKTVQDRHRTHW